MNRLLGALLALALALAAGNSPAEQAVLSPLDPTKTSGTELAGKLVDFEGALLSYHSGTTAPTYAVQGTPWLDTSKVSSGGFPVLKRYDGNSWLADSVFDTDRHQLLPSTGKLNATGGTSTAYTLNTGYEPTALWDGFAIQFRAHATNTGASTLNVNALGARPLRRAPNTELLPGTIVSGSLYRATYSDTNGGEWIIDNPFGSPSPAAPGVTADCACFTAPERSFFTDGQAVSRSIYGNLFEAITVVQTGTGNAGQAVLTGFTGIDTLGIAQGTKVEGPGIAAGTTVKSIDSSSQITLSANLTTSGARSVRFFPWGNGDGATTFNLPDTKGKFRYTRDNLGGTAALVAQVQTTITTTAGSATATVASVSGIARGWYVSAKTIPAGTKVTDISGATITLSNGTGVLAGTDVPVRFSPFSDASALGGTGGELSHVQALAELVQHLHGTGTLAIVPNPHNHTEGKPQDIGKKPSSVSGGSGGWGDADSNITNTSSTSLSIIGNTANTGLSQPFNVTNPGIGFNTIIYY